MSEAMSDAELAGAQDRHDAYKRNHDHLGADSFRTARASADDVPGLLAEVKRLRKVNKDLAKLSLRTMERAAAAEERLAGQWRDVEQEAT